MYLGAECTAGSSSPSAIYPSLRFVFSQKKGFSRSPEAPCKFGAAAAAAAALYCTHSIWKADKRTNPADRPTDEKKNSRRKKEGRKHGGNFKFNFAALSLSLSLLTSPTQSLSSFPIPTIGLGSHRFIKQRLYSPPEGRKTARRPSASLHFSLS